MLPIVYLHSKSIYFIDIKKKILIKTWIYFVGIFLYSWEWIYWNDVLTFGFFSFVEHYKLTLSHKFCEIFYQEPSPSFISFKYFYSLIMHFLHTEFHQNKQNLEKNKQIIWIQRIRKKIINAYFNRKEIKWSKKSYKYLQNIFWFFYPNYSQRGLKSFNGKIKNF